MKVQHATAIEVPPEATALALKRALEDIPDDAAISIEVQVTEPDRPGEFRQRRTTLRAVWEAVKP